MSKPKKKLTSMVWTQTVEIVLLTIVVSFILIYLLYTYGYIYFSFDALWPWGILHGLSVVGIVAMIGAGFGFWQSGRTKKRLEQLEEEMQLLEKGHLSLEIPTFGEDEIGRLGEQLESIRKRWEEQVNSLQRLSTSNAQLAEKARFSAVNEERQRLARELHDAVSQQLFAISMTATALGRILDKDTEKSRHQVSLIEEMASAAQSEMRALLLHLRPVHLEGKRLSQGLQDLLQELQAKVPMEIIFEMDDGIKLSKGVEDHLFRIVQEALSNTLRHSKAEKVEIRLLRRGETVRLMIRDDGIGFDLNQKKQISYGLVSMEERVMEIGGTLQIVTAPGKGTRIDIRVPIVIEEERMV